MDPDSDIFEAMDLAYMLEIQVKHMSNIITSLSERIEVLEGDLRDMQMVIQSPWWLR